MFSVVKCDVSVEVDCARRAVTMSLQAEQERNAGLRATLESLGAPSPRDSGEQDKQAQSEVKAKERLLLVKLSESELMLKQKIAKKELQVKQLLEEIKEDKEDLKSVRADIDAARSAGRAVWEEVGIKTVSYRDPFHTGLSKRTPTGAPPPPHRPPPAPCAGTVKPLTPPPPVRVRPPRSGGYFTS